MVISVGVTIVVVTTRNKLIGGEILGEVAMTSHKGVIKVTCFTAPNLCEPYVSLLNLI